jgi:phosphatidylglycerophosphate synthase
LLAALEPWIPVPNINPSWWFLLGLVGSVACLYASTPEQKFALVFGVFLTDWWDGATARRHGTTSREGYIMDVVVDRFSEAFIFLADIEHAAGRAFFLLWMLNMALTLWSARTGTRRILPLRLVWLGVLARWMLA